MASPETCLICGYEEFEIRSGGSSREYVCLCQRCGSYSATHEFLLFHEDRNFESKMHLLSGLVREINEDGGSPNILYKNLNELLADSRIPKDDDTEAKAGKIINYLRRKSKHYGNAIGVHLHRDRSIAYAVNAEEFDALIGFLQDTGLITGDFMRGTTGRVVDAEAEFVLTAKGWKESRNDESRQQSEQAFIAIRFENDADPFIEAIEEAITEAGYKPMCIKEKHYPERVMDKALGEIRKSRFVVVDLTKNRCAVSFEAGFAYALGIETIPIFQKGEEKVEDFYVKHFKYLEYVDPADLKQRVLEAIKARVPKN